MLRTLPFAVFAILTLSSCNSPYVQNYALSRIGSNPLPSMQGEVAYADGEPASPNRQLSGAAKERLITFIFLTPGAGGNGSRGGGFDSGSSVATFKLTNGISPDNVDARAEWDKRTDVVEIDGAKYDRLKGTLFVIVKSPGSPGKIWQLVVPSGTTKDKDLLKLAKKELPNVKTVQAASFELNR